MISELVDEYNCLSSWDAANNINDCCIWRGVHCDNETNFVTRLDLHGLSDPEFGFWPVAPLKGIISSSLLELQQLAYLDLSLNDFSYAHIPQFIGSLKELQYLNLSLGNFSGPIPTHIGNLSKLLSLDLSLNSYYVFPRIHSNNLDWVANLHLLEYLDLSSADFSKARNWLQSLSKLNFIKVLHLGGCGFPVPSFLPPFNVSPPLVILNLAGNFFPWNDLFHLTVDWFSNFSYSLTYIDLSGNLIHGPVPDALTNMRSLAHLGLSSNELTGGIPDFTRNMSNLKYLNFQYNQLTWKFVELVMNMSGPIEKKVEYLDLRINGLSGFLPNMSVFSSLTELNLGHNQFSGPIPQEFLQLPHLAVLDLVSNNFTGQLPDFSNISLLKELYLSNNSFGGTLPTSLGSLSKLEVLSLGLNQLGGVITEVNLINLSRLQSLDLSFNSLLSMSLNTHWVPPFQLDFQNFSEPRNNYCISIYPIPKFQTPLLACLVIYLLH